MSQRAATTEIVIVSWNGRSDTLLCVQSVVAQARSSSSEVLITVVDNGSIDGTSEAIASKFANVKVIRLGKNHGFTGGIRAAAEKSSADFLIFLNNDAVAREGWLRSTIDALSAAAPDVVAIGGKIVDPTGTLVDFIGGSMTFDGHALQNGFRKPLAEVEEPANGSELLFACGGNMMVRREAYLRLGGFDDDYFAYLEDVDFGWRVWSSGGRILYNSEAAVSHKSSATSDRLGNYERGVLFERNALQTALKNYDEASFASASSGVFLTFLHRLHTYATTRNVDTAWLTRPPFGTAAKTEQDATVSWRTRLARFILGRRDCAIVDDPLTAMQFRALEWFFANSSNIMRKRDAVQRLRTRSDREIFSRFPLLYVPTYPGDAALYASSLFQIIRPALDSVDRSLEEIISR